MIAKYEKLTAEICRNWSQLCSYLNFGYCTSGFLKLDIKTEKKEMLGMEGKIKLTHDKSNKFILYKLMKALQQTIFTLVCWTLKLVIWWQIMIQIII